jgi:hypothetical protein
MLWDRFPRGWVGAGLVVLGVALAGACAVGLDPVRLGAGGAGTGGSSSSTSSTSGSTTSTSASSASSTSSTSASSASSAASSAGASSSSTSASSATSASSSSGGPATGLVLEYYCAAASPMTQQIQPQFEIQNNGSSPVLLSSLTIRYFYTKDGSLSSDQNFVCDYAQIGAGNVSAVFNTTTGTNADEYLELHLAAGAGTLAAGANSGPIQARVYGNGYPTFDQTNDYSFDPTKTTFAPWTKVTLYQNGTLVWGTEP